MVKKIVTLLVILIGIDSMQAQKREPVTWSVSVTEAGENGATVALAATIEKGWHLYGLQLPDDGPHATSVTFDLPDGVAPDGGLTPSHAAVEKFDAIFSLNLPWWDSEVTLTQRLTVKDGHAHDISGTIRFQACNGQTCIAPQRVPFNITIPECGNTSAGAGEETMQEPESEQVNNTIKDNSVADNWQATPIFDEDAAIDSTHTSPWVIFLWGLGAGFIALLTPCIWPMLPVTVGYFRKKSKRLKGVIEAIIYGLAVTLIYWIIGVVSTAVLGISKVYEITTSIWVNVPIFILLFSFAISFLGGFTFRLPSSWRRKVDKKTHMGYSIGGIFLMALTLAIVSIPSTCPIIGTLLSEVATTHQPAAPMIAMAGFAIAISIPFSIFAFYPSVLREMPTSDETLNLVKVTIGFVVLALSLTFISIADSAYHWEILNREAFLAVWVVIFVTLSLYLFGKLHLLHNVTTRRIGIRRLLCAMASLSFALYLLPGIFGRSIAGINSICPPMTTNRVSFYNHTGIEVFDDYDAGMKAAVEAHKPVLIDFSQLNNWDSRGFDNTTFNNELICNKIRDNFVFIRLIIDDKTKLPEPKTVEINGTTKQVYRVGEAWECLQTTKFGINKRPILIALDAGGNPIGTPLTVDSSQAQLNEWINRTIAEHKNSK
jgi:thiol:disulfide interchange protein DsbD